MRKNYLLLLIFFIICSAKSFSQSGTFTFESGVTYNANNSALYNTVNSITLTIVSDGSAASIMTQDWSSYPGNFTKNVVMTNGIARPSVTLTFSQAINLTSLVVADFNSANQHLLFTPNTGTPYDMTINGALGSVVNVNFKQVTSVVISNYPSGGTVNPGIDNIVFSLNSPPTAANNTVTINEDNDKTFSASEFNYSDADGNPMSQIQVVSVPSTGSLYKDTDGDNTIDGGETLSASSTVSKTDIDAGRLKFKPVANGNGSPYTTFTFKVHDGAAYSASSYTMTINVTAVNDAPTSSANSVTINEDNYKTFTATDFPFSDGDAGNVLTSIQITTLESDGVLFLDANSNNIEDTGEDITLNQVITSANIPTLKFAPFHNGNGNGYATFQFKVNDGTEFSASSYIMTINVTSIPDLTFANGSDYNPVPVPNTDNNPVGRFSIAADDAGINLTAVTISFSGDETNTTSVKLWSSTDPVFDDASDTQLGSSKSYSTSVTFNGFSSSISASVNYYFVTFDLGAATGSISSTIPNEAAISVTGGTWVNAFTDAHLSAGAIPLPVELISFTASPQNHNVLLKWSTATETNNYGFDIERASTGSAPNWEKMGFVNGAGNSNSPKDYSFVDTNPLVGKQQYRLKQIDTDGGYEYYSQTAEVNFSLTGIKVKKLPKEFALEQNYPNPFNPSTVINYQLPVNGHVELKIYNVLGKEVAVLVNEEMDAGYHEVKFDASNLSAGMYIYQLRTNNFISTKKLLLLK